MLSTSSDFIHCLVWQEVYKPQRKYKRQKGAEELLDEESKVHATLLEYGRWKAWFGC